MHEIEFWGGRSYDTLDHALEVTVEEHWFLERVRLELVKDNDWYSIGDIEEELQDMHKEDLDCWFESELYEPLAAALYKRRLDQKVDGLIKE